MYAFTFPAVASRTETLCLRAGPVLKAAVSYALRTIDLFKRNEATNLKIAFIDLPHS